MDWLAHPDTAAVGAAVGMVSGWWVPRLIAAIPEPPPDTADDRADHKADHKADRADNRADDGSDLEADVEADDNAAHGAHDETDVEVGPEPKERYADIAALPGLPSRTSLAGAAAGALSGAALGWVWSLTIVAFLVPVAVALAVVDWRTRLLPTRLIAPSYAVVVVLVLLGAVVTRDTDDLVRAGWGWLAAGLFFWLLWRVHPRGMGYGDVRLSGLLGIALGQLGWPALVVGLYAGFLLGGVAGLVLARLGVVERGALPFGPFMLVGALVGVVWGEPVAASLR